MSSAFLTFVFFIHSAWCSSVFFQRKVACSTHWTIFLLIFWWIVLCSDITFIADWVLSIRCPFSKSRTSKNNDKVVALPRWIKRSCRWFSLDRVWIIGKTFSLSFFCLMVIVLHSKLLYVGVNAFCKVDFSVEMGHRVENPAVVWCM